MEGKEDSYRSLEEWIDLLKDLKVWEIKESGSIGLTLDRLHGVPSAWLIAEKK